MQEAAVQKNVGDWLPEAKAWNRAQGHQAKKMIHPRGHGGIQKNPNEQLHEVYAGANEHQELDTGRNESAPVKADAPGTVRGGHKCSLRLRRAGVKVRL